MKFKDIPQFTSDGHYMIDVPISFIKKIIEDYKSVYGLEMNPDFQRGNVWTEEQQIAYVEYFFKGGKSANVIYFNHPDFGRGIRKDSDMKNMVLVDGLQRLTAIIKYGYPFPSPPNQAAQNSQNLPLTVPSPREDFCSSVRQDFSY